MNKLKFKLEKVLKEYISAFEKKHDVEMEFAVNDDLMGVISFGSINYFNIADIIYDIDNNLEKGLIFCWVEDVVDFNSLKETKHQKYINLHSYAHGMRYEAQMGNEKL